MVEKSERPLLSPKSTGKKVSQSLRFSIATKVVLHFSNFTVKLHTHTTEDTNWHKTDEMSELKVAVF